MMCVCPRALLPLLTHLTSHAAVLVAAADNRKSSSEHVAGYLARASDLYAQAQRLAMKEYALPGSILDVGGGADSDNNNDDEGSPTHRQQQQRTRDRAAKSPPTRSITRDGSNNKVGGRDHFDNRSALQSPPQPSTIPRLEQHQQHESQHEAQQQHPQHPNGSIVKSHDELARVLRVKDQMIYELLRERAEMRKQTASMEAYLEELSVVSTAEMKKWARLTDEMQAEIEHLRVQLERSPRL